MIWGNCNTTQFKALEKMHARAARIVHGLDWNMETEQVLAKTNWKTLLLDQQQTIFSSQLHTDWL